MAKSKSRKRKSIRDLAARCSASVIRLGSRGANIGLEAITEGARSANPLTDLKRVYDSGLNMIRNGFSMDAYFEDLKQGKFLGAGNGATIGLYTGLVASGSYIPLKITQGVLGAGAAITRNVISSEPVRWAADKIGKKKKLDRITKKDNFRKKVSPKLNEGALGIIGYAPLIAGMWGSQLTAKVGTSLEKSRFKTLRVIGETLHDFGSRANNILQHGLTIVSLSNAINSTPIDITKLENAMGNVGNHLEEIVNDGTNTIRNIANEIIYDDADFGLEKKFAVLVAGYGPSHEQFPMADQAHEYESLLKAGFKPENIYVVSPEGVPLNNSSLALAQAYQDNSYSHESTKQNLESIIKEISEKADGNDSYIFAVSSHGLYDQTGSLFAIDNGNEVVYDSDLREWQRDLHAGGELNLIFTCQGGNHADVVPDASNPGWGNYRPNVGVITECRTDQNSQAYGSYGEQVFNIIAEDGFDHETDIGELAEKAEEAYVNSWRSINRESQDPVINDNGTRYSLVTNTNGDMYRAPHTERGPTNAPSSLSFTPIHFSNVRRKAA